MDENALKSLCDEMRDEYQVPPYYETNQLKILAKDGEAALGALNQGCDIEGDRVYRSLLKNYMYYALHHRSNEFFENYRSQILTWQMETEVDANV